MNRSILSARAAIGSVLMLSMAYPTQAYSKEAMAQSLPRIPKVKVPPLRMPRSGERAQPVNNQRPETKQERQANYELEQRFRLIQSALTTDFSFNWTSEADNPQVDQAAAEYYAMVDEVTSGEFDRLHQTVHNNFRTAMKIHYDGRSTERWIDRQITFAENNRGVGAGDRTYNDLLTLEVMLYGAVTLFPDNQQYAAAKAKVDAAMVKYGGSRTGARQRKEADALAQAKLVRMPTATQSDRSVENLFRRAWETSGIPYTIRKIHIRSGWAPKRNGYGVVIGQVRDAAIAVEDPTSGKCYLYDFTMIKEGSAVRRSSHAAKQMACDNIPD